MLPIVVCAGCIAVCVMIGGLIFFMFNLSLVNVTSHFRDERPNKIGLVTEKRTLTIFTTVMKADVLYLN